MNKHAIRIEIGQILDNRCGPCPYGGYESKKSGRTSSRLVEKCYSCPHYKRLRELGRLLGSEEREMTETLTIENFVTWKKAGLLNKAIANKVGKTPSNLSSWAAYHRKEIDAEMAKQHKKPGPKTGRTTNAETDSQKDRRIAALVKDKSELTVKLNLCNTSISRLNEELKTAKDKLTETQSALDESARSEADAHKKVDELQKQLDDALKEVKQRIRIHDEDLKTINKYAQLLEALELFVYHSLESELDV